MLSGVSDELRNLHQQSVHARSASSWSEMLNFVTLRLADASAALVTLQERVETMRQDEEATAGRSAA